MRSTREAPLFCDREGLAAIAALVDSRTGALASKLDGIVYRAAVRAVSTVGPLERF